ncbi:MAG: hypothetical protein KJ043_23105, partial [Anaerolineae bacterium]|nr:hypothetical protein [Anaerolineae bacterium]
GLLLLTSGQILPNATPPPINRAVENMDVAMQQEQLEVMPSSAQIITEETTEQESADMDAVSQRAMPTVTLSSSTVGMMPMPTPTLSVMPTQSAMPQANQPQMPAPMMDMTATMSAESFAESAPVVAFAPTMDAVPETMDVLPVDDVAQNVAEDAMTDITTMSMVTSPEITPIPGVIEILGNAIPLTETLNTILYDNQQGGVAASAITQTPEIAITTDISDSTSSTNITMIIGIGLIIIGIIAFVATLWRWRKG